MAVASLASVALAITVDRAEGIAAPEWILAAAVDTVASDSVTTALADSIAIEPAPEPINPLALRGHGRPNLIRASRLALTRGGSDLVYLYTTPLRMTGKNVFQTGAVVGTGALLYAYDEEIEGGFARSRDNGVYRALLIDAGGALEPLGLIAETNGWLAGAAAAGWVFDVPLLRTIPVEMLESNFIVGALRQPVQRLTRRSRPSDHVGSRSFGKGGQSFPSGHSSVVCEYASILSHHFKRPVARVAIWTVAGLVCLQRIDDPNKSHWPSDVWLGAALGAYGGHTIARRNEERRRGVAQGRWYDVLHRTSADLLLMPTVEPLGFVGSLRF